MFRVQHMKNLSGVNVAPFLDTIGFIGPFHTGEEFGRHRNWMEHLCASCLAELGRGCGVSSLC